MTHGPINIRNTEIHSFSGVLSVITVTPSYKSTNLLFVLVKKE